MRDLTAQVHAINRGFAQLKNVESDFVGNLDADVTLEPAYFERLLEKSREARLGLAGGFIHEEKEGQFQSRKSNVESSVAHAVQLFRRECLEELGGYRPFTWAGADWYARSHIAHEGLERSFDSGVARVSSPAYRQGFWCVQVCVSGRNDGLTHGHSPLV